MARSYYSTLIEAPADQVWATVRDFNGLSTWFASAVSASEIEDGRTGDTVSAVRRFTLGDDQIRERLVGMSDVERSYTYEFVPPAPFPVTSYRATLRVTPVTDTDRAFVEWWAEFDCEADQLEHWQGFFAAEVFTPALDSLRTTVAGARP